MSKQIEYVVCDKCGSTDVVEHEKEVVRPLKYLKMSEYAKAAEEKEKVTFVSYGRGMPKEQYLTCLSCGFEVKFVVPEWS
jgi:hypothetical protein